ncbi:MAG: hydroxymethylbilane synthase [Bacillota bacterium]
MSDKVLRIAARGSALAIKQVDEVMAQLPDCKFGLQAVTTIGDSDKQRSLWDNAPGDFFTREIDEQLLAGQADIAIHSAKDLPYPLPPGIVLLALTKAADNRDTLVSRDNKLLAELPVTSRIGTSSAARRENILALRADLTVVSIRGNIEERLQQVDDGSVDGLIVAACALQRLGLAERITQFLPIDAHPLQGRLAVTGLRNRADLRVLFSAIDDRRTWGKVWLVGAGIGDADNITVKSDRILRCADVIVHDELIPAGLLERYHGRKIAVGKRVDRDSARQPEIQKLLLDLAQSGQNVARLKGGDPLIFARGGEETSYLQSNFVHVEVAPGISAFQAAAAALNMPLSERGINNQIVIKTTRSTLDEEQALQIYYMGGRQLVEIQSAALAEYSTHTPAAIISEIGGLAERTQIVELQELPTLTPQLPALVLVGANVGQIIAQEKVLFTGLDSTTCRLNYRLVNYPLIAIAETDYVRPDLEQYDALLFTSKTAVRQFMAKQRPRCQALISIGAATTACLASYGYRADYQAERADSDVLCAWLKQQSFQRVLYPTSQLSQNKLHRLANVEPLVIYHTDYRQQPAVDLTEYIGVVFTSPSTVEGFFKLYSEFPDSLVAYVYGKHTARRARECGCRNVVVL